MRNSLAYAFITALETAQRKNYSKPVMGLVSYCLEKNLAQGKVK